LSSALDTVALFDFYIPRSCDGDEEKGGIGLLVTATVQARSIDFTHWFTDRVYSAEFDQSNREFDPLEIITDEDPHFSPFHYSNAMSLRQV
jgi:hypothetical protein